MFTCTVCCQVNWCNFQATVAKIFCCTSHDFSASTNFGKRNIRPLYHTQGTNGVSDDCRSGITSYMDCFVSWFPFLLEWMFCLLWPYSKSDILKSSAAEVIKQLSGPLLVRMMHTRDGSRIGMLCIKHGSAKVCSSSFLCVYLLYKNSKKISLIFVIVICYWSINFSFFFSLLSCLGEEENC